VWVFRRVTKLDLEVAGQTQINNHEGPKFHFPRDFGLKLDLPPIPLSHVESASPSEIIVIEVTQKRNLSHLLNLKD
jgi:hypothetical protein